MPLGGLSFWGARAYARSKTNKKPTNLTQKALPPRQNPPFRQTLYRISLSRQQERQEIQVTIEKCLMGICIELTPIDASAPKFFGRSEEHTSELQSHVNLVCRLLLEKKISSLAHKLTKAQQLPKALPHQLTTHNTPLSLWERAADKAVLSDGFPKECLCQSCHLPCAYLARSTCNRWPV